jgi:hypothetical protein
MPAYDTTGDFKLVLTSIGDGMVSKREMKSKTEKPIIQLNTRATICNNGKGIQRMPIVKSRSTLEQMTPPLRSALVLLGLFLLTPALSRASAESVLELYEVPAISSIPRLPDALPSDARPSRQLRIVATPGEFEPVSFVIAPHADVYTLTLNASPLSSSDGKRIPAANIDIKVVKCWYQGGTAWYSYFGDSNRRELVPELLLNDENLVRVDREKKENHLRVGDEYRWISYPREKATEAFNYLTEPVADSKLLQPIRLRRGEHKQIWVTIEVPKDCAAGIYRGSVTLQADGKPASEMGLALRVLPFALPIPKTYYNLDSDYLVTLYGTGIYDLCNRLGIAPEIADRQQKAIYKNILKHNVFNCRSDLTLSHQKDRPAAIARLQHELRMMKSAGFQMKPLLSRGWAYPAGEKDMAEYKTRIDDLVETIVGEVGHRDVYITSWDEAGVDRIKIIRDYAKHAASKGIKLWLTTHEGRHFNLAGYAINFANHGGWPKREQANKWHALGANVASYAGPHTGPENPDVFRRMEGLARYKAYYDGSFNYTYFSALHPTLHKKQKQNVWNDVMGGTFRRFNLVYPTANGVVDTIAWEGFREGIDDVRYATKLKQDAEKAIASRKVEAIYAAKKALMWLELLDDRAADLNAARLEMIEYILKIQTAMGN